MWQNILVITIVAVTAFLVGWNFYRKLTGKSSGSGGCSGCSGCSAAASTGCADNRADNHGGNARGPSAQTPLHPMKGCGCGH